MMKKFCSTLPVIIFSISAFAGNKIKIYFNHPVDNTVSTGVNAVYLNSCIADTVVAYINRAKYTMDIAVYDFTTGSYASISSAVNSAYARGVKVRWIYDGSSSNTALPSINPGIYTLGSPTSGSYGIMHNKFLIIDAYSSDPSDAIVWTGSTNWSAEQFNTDYNNVVVIQDSALAHAYTDEFNMMWGGTGISPTLASSKFGPHKTDLGKHSFTIEGHHVELYFSPSDGTNSQILNTIATANTDLYFGVYAFTDNSDATAIMTKNSSGVYVSGIVDNFSNSYSPYTTFTSGLGSHFISYSGTGIYHNKFMIVDPSNKCSDPLVLTGSHNWSVSADTKNDENTLIIHSDTAANIYYQSFKANFNAMGGPLSTVGGCPTSVVIDNTTKGSISIYPNPSNGDAKIAYQLRSQQNINIAIYNIVGQKIATPVNNELQKPGLHSIGTGVNDPGVYFIELTTADSRTTQKFVVSR